MSLCHGVLAFLVLLCWSVESHTRPIMWRLIMRIVLHGLSKCWLLLLRLVMRLLDLERGGEEVNIPQLVREEKVPAKVLGPED